MFFSSFKMRSMGSGKSAETKVEMTMLTSEKTPSSVKEKGKDKHDKGKTGKYRIIYCCIWCIQALVY